MEGMGHQQVKKKRAREERSYRETDSKSDSELQDLVIRKAQKVVKQLRTSRTYSNDNNRFGDPNLNEGFVWREKIKQELTQGLMPSEMSLKSEKERQRERMAQVEKLKKRREERLIEKAHHEHEMVVLARERAGLENQHGQKQEQEFYCEQSKARSAIRLRESRPKPIDVICKNLHFSEYFDPITSEPYKIFKSLSMKEVEELRLDIKMYLEFDRATETHIQFWEAMMVVCDWEIVQTRKRDSLDRARLRGEETPPDVLAEDGHLLGVSDEIDRMLQGLSVIELDAWLEQIEAKMVTGTSLVLENQFQAIRQLLFIYKAKARLRQIYVQLHAQHVDGFGKRVLSENHDVKQHKETSSDWGEVRGHVHETQRGVEEDAGGYSPTPTAQDVDGSDVLDPEADKADLKRRRAEFLNARQRRLQEVRCTRPVELTPLEHAYVTKSMGEMEPDDTILGQGSEINLESQTFWWHDQHRPRKPKYFNIVQTSYVWNKYNHTHYDHDNPPPKMVQGYKFNIFYPDLLDETRVPTFFTSDAGETCIIHFHAGPPYQDIAFRILNKEWENSPKKGFKCTFEQRTLHLYFNFKRCRYRR